MHSRWLGAVMMGLLLLVGCATGDEDSHLLVPVSGAGADVNGTVSTPPPSLTATPRPTPKPTATPTPTPTYTPVIPVQNPGPTVTPDPDPTQDASGSLPIEEP
ncbi:MAG TPA: hypothetical protein V6D00_05645 [Pantanalinema sp.]